jgi:putative aminopeptidase FrvX
MTNTMLRRFAIAATLPLSASAQSADDRVLTSVSAWISLTAPPGAEDLAAPAIRALPGWTQDVNGNFVKRAGRGSPRRVVACAFDVSAYVVSQITDDGYLRLHRAGANPAHPLWDQSMEAHKVRIYTARSAVPGVVAINNGHFAPQHRGDTTVVNVDELWVDIGASSRAEAEALGVALLDPVVPDRPTWTYASYAAGPAAGARAGCGAVATAAQGTVTTGETVFILAAQHVLNNAGLTAALARLGQYDSLTIVGEARGGGRGGRGGRGGVAAQMLTPRASFAGSFVESISVADARELLARVAAAAGVALGAEPTWAVPAIPAAPARRARTDAYEDHERLVMQLLDLPGVPMHEWRVRDAVRAALPAWARDRAVVDSAGNLVVAVGPDRDSVAFIAHMDEVSFEVERILPDGNVTLTNRGGVIRPAWEGQPAVLHFDRDAAGNAAESLRGVFVPRDTARVKAPPRLTAWFGVDSAGLVARGVRVGSAITGWKRAVRLAGTRITGRSSDDRTGSAALIMAARRLDPSKLTQKVIFVWSVGEEGGLVGAGAFGARHGAGLRRVYAIDTFVSSDTPLESPLFAYAPLGKGAVLRGLDGGSVSSRAERERIIRIARAAGIPLQVGTTQGSTDGSAVGRYGPPNMGLSWPGRYSHTPGEVLDLRDMDALSRLIVAVANAPQ